MNNDLQGVIDWLKSNGWSPTRKSVLDKCDYLFVKRFPGEIQCKSNEGKKLQITAHVYSDVQSGIAVELHLRGEPQTGGCWIDFLTYSIGSVENVPANCERLLKAWRAIQTS